MNKIILWSKRLKQKVNIPLNADCKHCTWQGEHGNASCDAFGTQRNCIVEITAEIYSEITDGYGHYLPKDCDGNGNPLGDFNPHDNIIDKNILQEKIEADRTPMRDEKSEVPEYTMSEAWDEPEDNIPQWNDNKYRRNDKKCWYPVRRYKIITRKEGDK